MNISAANVKALRERTGAGIMDCKKALMEADGDIDKAIEYLRKKGAALAEKKQGRETNEGAIEAYIHPGNRLGVLLEINCETDFVAKTPDFQTLARDIAMQIAATNPIAVKREDVPQELIEREKDIYRTQAKNENKPEHIIEKVIEGKIEKFYQENVLMEQHFVKDPNKTIREVITDAIAKLGENISVRRFVRYELGAE